MTDKQTVGSEQKRPDEQMAGRTAGWTDERMHGWTNGSGRTAGRTDAPDGRTEGWTDRRTDGRRTDGRTEKYRNVTVTVVIMFMMRLRCHITSIVIDSYGQPHH